MTRTEELQMLALSLRRQAAAVQYLDQRYAFLRAADAVDRLLEVELAFSFVFEMAEGHSVRGDDCGRLAKAVLAARAVSFKPGAPT